MSLYLIENLEILRKHGFPEKEMQKVKRIFESDFAVIIPEEAEETLSYLEGKGIYITEAKQVKVLAISPNEIMKKISILEEIHEVDVYKEDANRINLNVIDIYKRIQYCKQYNVPYRNETGKYEKFLFNKDEWNKVAERIKQYEADEPIQNVSVEPVTSEKVESKPEYEIDLDAIHNNYHELNSAKDELSKMKEKVEISSASNDVTAKGQYDENANFYDIINGELNEISFADLEPETYGGRSL